jgi:AraC-like DNA-binding protein
MNDDTIEVMPDGCFDIVLDVAAAGPNAIILTGVWDQIISVSVPARRMTVGVRFLLPALEAFFACTLADIRNQVIPLSPQMLRRWECFPIQTLETARNPAELTEAWDDYFVLCVIEEGLQPRGILHLDLLDCPTVEAAADELGISQRHLSRLYQANLGIAPKTYTRIARFFKAKEILLKSPQSPLAEVAASCEYFDQAHLSKEFRRFSGMTPKAFLEKYCR